MVTALPCLLSYVNQVQRNTIYLWVAILWVTIQIYIQPYSQSEGSANYFQYKSEATDKLFADGAVELDEAKRKDIYADLQAQIAEDAAFYPIVDSRKVLAVNNQVGTWN